MAEITMPRLSGSMEQGTIIHWLRRDGEFVSAGEELVEVETDKATMSVESEHSGVLTIVAPDGETVAVGALIARVAVDSDAAPDTARDATEPAPAAGSTPRRSHAGSPPGSG